jgi:hypothetical protein
MRGIGITSWDGQTGNIGYVAKTIDFDQMSKLIEDIRQAQIGFIPYMELVDKIVPSPREFPEPAEGRLIAGIA